MIARSLTLAHVMDELARLARVFPRPGWAPEDPATFARDYLEVCGALTGEQFSAAVDGCRASDRRFFPRPGELLALARQQPRPRAPAGGSSDFDAWVRAGYRDGLDGPLTPCPGCGRAWGWYPRLKLVHDHAHHVARGLACIGACDVGPPTCLGPGRVDGGPARESPGTLWTPTAAAAPPVPDRRQLAGGAREPGEP